MDKKIPEYLISRKNIITLVIFTAIFALVFINVYAPFGVNTWFSVTKIELFLYSSFVILTGMLVVVISRVIMFLFCRFSLINYWQYALWVLVEILSMAFVYSIFVKFILVDSRDFIDIWSVSIKNTSLVLIIPYVLLWMFFSWKDKNEKLDQITESEKPATSTKVMVPFYDEKGTMRISIKQDDLIYLSAADNYVTMHYIDGSKVSKMLIRNSMKFFENELKDFNIIRCHRSYMVNFNKVKMIRKDSDGLQIDLDLNPVISLPVSKKYSEEVMVAFGRYARI
ncbi:LytR/AlgR family response regulator transcription factor [Bacteroidota bacterium]